MRTKPQRPWAMHSSQAAFPNGLILLTYVFLSKSRKFEFFKVMRGTISTPTSSEWSLKSKGMIDPKGNCKETGETFGTFFTRKSIKKKEKQTLLNVGRLALRPLGETLATTCGLRFSVRSNDGHLGSISGPSQTSPPSTLKPVIGGLGIKAVDGRLRVGKPIPKVIQTVLR